jgi:uncharacterized membrane protein
MDLETVNPNKWFGIVIAFTALTLLCVYLIPNSSVLSVFKIGLGFVFVAFVPGYCLINFLFEEGKLDLAEIIVLSVALSFSLAGISGLFLGISPIGLTFASIADSLISIVVVLAVLAYLRKTGLIKRTLQKLRKKPPLQVPS